MHVYTDLNTVYNLIRKTLRNVVRTHVNFTGIIPSTGGSEEGQTRNAASCRRVNQTRYQLSYSGRMLNNMGKVFNRMISSSSAFLAMLDPQSGE